MSQFPPITALRPRAVGVACVAAVLLAGGAVAAGPASAVTASSITLNAPAVVGNAGTAGAGSGTIAVVNADTAASTTSHIDLDITGPAAIKAANLAISGLPSGDTAVVTDASGSSAGVEITITLTTLAPGSTTIPFTLSVNTGATPTTGTLSTVASLFSSSTATTADATSAPSTTQVVTGPSAPKFNVPGAATIYQGYSAALLSLGTPAATVRVFDNKPNSGTTGTTSTAVTPTTGTNGDALYALNDKLVFDATTGTVTGRAVDLGKTDAKPDSFTIIANNGVGGASTTAPATTATPAIALHDVSQTITIPVLFADVAINSTFGTAIYALAADGTISGYGDGTFRTGNPVTRDAFVKFAAGVLNKGGFFTPTGACDATHPSAFSDVPATSPFCQQIAALSSEGIVNGYSNGTFRPGVTVARDAATAFLYRVDEKFRGVDPKSGGDAQCTSPTPFSDVTTKNVFCGDIEWAAKNGITQGFSDGGFHPAAGSSRAESAQFVYKLEALEKLV